ncbi:MAG TPA: hypothetical protein VHY91_01485 [Pirellulales bacterium]|jgi:biopolymer transport protein ExbD|nr:hypothetical protein [Pirellulales bacterium]
MDRSKSLLSAALLLALAAGCQQTETPASETAPTTASSIVKVSALADGEILMDGKPCSPEGLTARLADAHNSGGQVYYYREAADQEPHPHAMKAMYLISESHLPVSFSTLPDFSDYVDEDGHSNPRP